MFKKGKKYTFYIVYAADAPKRLFRNPVVTMSKSYALEKMSIMRKNGFTPTLSTLRSDDIHSHTFAPISNFAKMERALA